MEIWCERQGRAWYEVVEQRVPGFYAAAGIDPDAIAAAALNDPEDDPVV